MAEEIDGEPTLIEMLDKASRRVTAALFMGSALIAIAVYAQSPPAPRYAVAAADGRVVRVDTRTGAVISCGADGCLSVHRPGGHIELQASLPKPPVPAPAALPAPQPAAQPAVPAKPYTDRMLKNALGAVDRKLRGETVKRLPAGLSLYDAA